MSWWGFVNEFELQEYARGDTMPRCCRRLEAVESETSPVGSSPIGACRWVKVLGRLVHVQRGVLGI